MNLNQVTVPTLDVERSIHFYQLLGLKLIVQSPHYARFEVPVGAATFSIHKVDSLIAGEGITIYFENENLDETVNRLVAEGLVFEEMPTDKKWLWREAKLKDPDGNQLIIYLAGKNRKDPPWKLNF